MISVVCILWLWYINVCINDGLGQKNFRGVFRKINVIIIKIINEWWESYKYSILVEKIKKLEN